MTSRVSQGFVSTTTPCDSLPKVKGQGLGVSPTTSLLHNAVRSSKFTLHTEVRLFILKGFSPPEVLAERHSGSGGGHATPITATCIIRPPWSQGGLPK